MSGMNTGDVYKTVDIYKAEGTENRTMYHANVGGAAKYILQRRIEMDFHMGRYTRKSLKRTLSSLKYDMPTYVGGLLTTRIQKL